MKNFSIKTVILSVLVGTTFLFVQCTGSSESETEGLEVEMGTNSGAFISVSQKQFETMRMELGSPKQEEFADGLVVQGKVEVPVEGTQEISAYFGGYVSGLKKLEGEAVRKGEVLFYLENPDFIRLQQDYLEAKSQLKYLESEYERQKTLFGEQISSQKNYFKAEAEFQVMKSKAEGLKRQLSLINIQADQLKPESIRSKIPVYSPINGFVESIYLVQGSFLEATGKAMTLINTEHLHMELVVFEKDAANLYIGQKVKVTIPDLPGKVMEAEVFMVGQSINEQRQINVRAHLVEEGQERFLVPGMFIEGQLEVNTGDAWLLPVTAVVHSEEASYVLLKKEESEGEIKLEKIQVEVGRQNSEVIEILPNQYLNENSVVLTKGGFNLLP